MLESLGFSLRQELVNDDLKRDLIEKARGVVEGLMDLEVVGERHNRRRSPNVPRSQTHAHPCPISAAFTNKTTSDFPAAVHQHDMVLCRDTINRHKTRENAREELAEFKARLNRAKEDAGHSPAGTE